MARRSASWYSKSDNGSAFIAQAFARLLERWRVELAPSVASGISRIQRSVRGRHWFDEDPDPP